MDLHVHIRESVYAWVYIQAFRRRTEVTETEDQASLDAGHDLLPGSHGFGERLIQIGPDGGLGALFGQITLQGKLAACVENRLRKPFGRFVSVKGAAIGIECPCL